jgi:urease accessory protein
MRMAEPVAASWKAELDLRFAYSEGRSFLEKKLSDGPLVVQKPLYPEGPGVCHAIVVHPPGGIAGGDELLLSTKVSSDSKALLTTPGAGKWYRSAGPWASQTLAFHVDGALEWLPRETIVFDGARGALTCSVDLGRDARFIGWEVVCLGRRGSGEHFSRGLLRLDTTVRRDGRLLFYERGDIEAGGRLMRSPAGLGGKSVFGTMIFTESIQLTDLRGQFAATCLPGLTIARYLGDSSEQALQGFAAIWARVRPSVMGREAVPPRIWNT